jgi:hypothetical protein
MVQQKSPINNDDDDDYYYYYYYKVKVKPST